MVRLGIQYYWWCVSKPNWILKMWAGKSVGKCILFESKWIVIIVQPVFENLLGIIIFRKRKWRSINYDGKHFGEWLAKTQQDQIVEN